MPCQILHSKGQEVDYGAAAHQQDQSDHCEHFVIGQLCAVHLVVDGRTDQVATHGVLTDINRRAGDPEFFVGDQLSLAVIAVIAMLGMQDIVINTGMVTAWQNFAPDMDDWNVLYPNLKRFDAHHRDRPSVKQTAPFMFDLAEKIV